MCSSQNFEEHLDLRKVQDNASLVVLLLPICAMLSTYSLDIGYTRRCG
jgi:hypothetical protein